MRLMTDSTIEAFISHHFGELCENMLGFGVNVTPANIFILRTESP